MTYCLYGSSSMKHIAGGQFNGVSKLSIETVFYIFDTPVYKAYRLTNC
jgi:hypothetical protein